MIQSNVQDISYGSIHYEDDHSPRRMNERSSWSKFVSVALLMTASVGGVFVLTWNSVDISSPIVAKNFGSVVASDALSFTASNEYGDTKSSKFAYPFLDDALLAEPYKTALFAITNAGQGCSYGWSITDSAESILDSGVTDDASFETSEFKTVGQYILSVTESDCDDISFARVAEQKIWVKYVRRELTTLTDDDREAFLDAMSTLWEVSTVDGQKIYGSRYKSLHYFASIHNDAGANSVCDEFHGGAGFVNNHMMLGAFLEQSMQLVDPSTCLHYMEYTKYFSMDAFIGHMENQLDGGTWTELLTDKWFGSNDPYSGEILDGRWASAQVPRVDTTFYEIHGGNRSGTWFPNEEKALREGGAGMHMMNPYGLLRSPWNWNPSTFVTRYNNINRISNIYQIEKFYRYMYSGDSCTNLQQFVVGIVVGGTLSNFMEHCEDNIHGIIHFTFGGVGGDNAYAVNQKLQQDYGFTETDLIVIARNAQTFVKNVYPFYFNNEKWETGNSMEYPVSCTDLPWDSATETLRTTSEPGSSDAKCSLNREYYCASDENMSLLLKYHEMLYRGSPIASMDLATKCEVMDLIISRAAFDGEMAGSGAALDPLFWVAHGAVERIMQKAIFSNVLTDSAYSSSDEHCSGHMNTGTKSWLEGFYFTDESVVVEELTNVEIGNILNPVTDEYRDYVNFVYDLADYDYCEGSESWFTLKKR